MAEPQTPPPFPPSQVPPPPPPAWQAPRDIPVEIDRWNWGAFLLNWIWGLGNNTFIALLTLIPFVGFVMLFVLGAKGSVWAWRNGRWDSVEHFKSVQRKWAIAGVVVWLAIIGGVFAIVGGAVYALRDSEAFQLAEMQLQSNVEVVEALGTPLSFGFPSGTVSIADQKGVAALTFSVSGPKASGQVAVAAVRENKIWRLERLVLLVDGSGRKIDLLKPTSARLMPLSRPSNGDAG